MKEREIFFDSEGLQLAGVLRTPEQGGRFPAVLLVHGSLEQDRDGNLLAKRDGKPAYRKNLFLEIARRLCAAGFAAFSWDRRGCGRSEGGTGDVFAQSRDAIAALHALQSQEEVDSQRIAVLGQSAGVYTACLLAREECGPKACVLQGGLFRDYAEMMAFNYERVARYAASSPENLAWVEENDLCSLIMGECDLNVPVGDAKLIKDELIKNGNQNVDLVIIPGADHSFQEIAEDLDLRLRERMSLESCKRPYCSAYFQTLLDFLKNASIS